MDEDGRKETKRSEHNKPMSGPLPPVQTSVPTEKVPDAHVSARHRVSPLFVPTPSVEVS